MLTDNESVTESKEEGDNIIMDDPDCQPVTVESTKPVTVTQYPHTVSVGEMDKYNNADSHPKPHSESAIDLLSNDVEMNGVDLMKSPKIKHSKEELKSTSHHSSGTRKETFREMTMRIPFEPREDGKSHFNVDLEPESYGLMSRNPKTSYTKLKRREKRKDSKPEEEPAIDTKPTQDKMEINTNFILSPEPIIKRGKIAHESDFTDDTSIAPVCTCDVMLMAYSNPVAGPSSVMEVNTSDKDNGMTDQTFLGPCHHSCMQFVDGKCQVPCGAQLECGDMCTGTCGTCHVGRIHQLCMEPCGKELICGHTCESTCKDYCPPCVKPCPIFCPHGPCPLTCSEPCRSCEEPCGWKCLHLSCSRKCGEDCDRSLCKERCPRKLFCGHGCVGICGEPCPPCRTCRPEAFPRIFQTEEEEDDEKGTPRSRYILLMCGHSVEITGLIKWWSSPEDETTENKQHQQVSMARCPSCRKVQTCRYLPTVRSTLRLIQLGKTELWWSRVDTLEEELLITLDEMRYELDMRSLDPAFRTNGHLMQFLEAKVIKLNSYKSAKGRRTNHSMSAHLFKMKCLQKMILTVLKFWKAYDDQVRNTLRENMTRLLNKMELFWNPERFGKQQFSDFTNETYRFCHQAQLNYIVLHSGYYNNNTRDDIKQLYDKIRNRLISSNRYSVAVSKENELDLEKLRKTVQVAPLITEEEKNMLYLVFPELRNFLYFNRGQGYLYKCPEGHVYFIGNCGQAEVASVCNLCNEKIGGEKHNLLHGSAYDLNQLNHVWPPDDPMSFVHPPWDVTHRDPDRTQNNMDASSWTYQHRIMRLQARDSEPSLTSIGATPLPRKRDSQGSQTTRQIGKEADFFTRVMREGKRNPQCLQSCDTVDRRTLMADLARRKRRAMEVLRLQRRMQDNALEDLFDDIRYQINTASQEQLGELRVAFDKDLSDEVFERGECFGCMAQGMIPEGIRLTANNVYEAIERGRCNHSSRGVNVPAGVTTNGGAAGGLALEHVKADILKEVEAKLDTLKPYFNQTPDLEQPGPSGVAAVSSSAPGQPDLASADSASASRPALSCIPQMDINNEDMSDHEWLYTADEPDEEVSSFTTDSD